MRGEVFRKSSLIRFSHNRASPNTRHTTCPPGSGCPLRGQASRMSSLIWLNTTKTLPTLGIQPAQCWKRLPKHCEKCSTAGAGAVHTIGRGSTDHGTGAVFHTIDAATACTAGPCASDTASIVRCTMPLAGAALTGGASSTDSAGIAGCVLPLALTLRARQELAPRGVSREVLRHWLALHARGELAP